MLTPDSRVRLDRSARFRRFDHEGIVIAQKSAEVLVISDVATRLLEIADGTRTLRECAFLLGEEYDAATDVIESDLVRFASELAQSGLVAVV